MAEGLSMIVTLVGPKVAAPKQTQT